MEIGCTSLTYFFYATLKVRPYLTRNYTLTAARKRSYRKQ